MAKTKIKKDELGLYVVAGGWIARPFYGTMFKEDDEVKTHHFGGSTNAGVTFTTSSEFNFKRDGQYEVWCTTGTSNTEYKNRKMFPKVTVDENKTFDEQLKDNFDWYKNHHSNGIGEIYKENNKKFADKYKV